MRIISIDVGIKNLAYCIIEADEASDEYKILLWNVINLCGEEPKCNCILKEKITKVKKVKKVKNFKQGEKEDTSAIVEPLPLSLCNKKAVYCKADKYFCQTHAKKSTEYLLPNAALKNIKKWKREALVEYLLAQGLSFSESCKKDELLAVITTYLAAKTLDKITTMSANEMTLIQMGIQLVKEFDRILGATEITFLDKIVIENQISPIANRMKTLQGMIAQYFIMRGNPHIAFISSANKLKMFTKPTNVPIDVPADDIKSNSKTSYNERKKAGVEIVKELLSKNNAIWLPFFLAHKKKDDLADAFLQGAWFLNKNIKIF